MTLLMTSILEHFHTVLSGMGTQFVTVGLRILLIMVVGWVAMVLIQGTIKTVRIRLADRMVDHESVKRAETLGRVLRYVVAVVVSLIAGMLILAELGVSLAPILGAAGVVGVAVGFGAQSLVKDYFTGFFLLLENQIRQGDVIRLGEHEGAVEELTLRYVRLRDQEGRVHFVPNGLITTVISMSRGHAYAMIDVGVAYRESVEDVMALMQRVGEQFSRDAKYRELLLEPIEMMGVEALADSAVVIRCRFKVKPLQQWAIRRGYLQQLKRAFDDAGVEIPYPHLTVFSGQPKTGTAPPFEIRVAAEA